jgi:RimJ/RimL family protein N-acetyltransferase
MAFEDINQPEIIDINTGLRLRKFDESEYIKALPWYQDPQVLYFSEGITDKVYNMEIINRMYKYLGSIGELYFIELYEDNSWKPVGDVTLSDKNMPIAIGDPKYWSRGIGKDVISKLLERAKEIGIKKICIPQIYKHNARSKNLFTSFGFVKVSENEREESFELKI